uniref:ZP domain-containing protein n=1 Tax=Anolis carolinensis TaxID=28377 RepID=G1KDS9_ANOCA|nr:PREDICTED: uncharacterized protein LOC100563455 [Anolis carolinensis]|eukprot:XP_008101764.1 PREDICTED: uncharacterized protein LOC100563455 [Anolis carolinensis]
MGWCLAIRLFLVAFLLPQAWLQFLPTAGQVEVECLGSLARLKLNSDYFQNKYISFSAIDKFGRPWLIDEVQATRCGYTIFRDVWGNIELRASLLGCYAQTVDDQHFTLNIQIMAGMNPEMRGAVVLNVPVSCSYGPWQPREIVCETNYMEVSVRMDVPPIPDGFLQDQPDDWESAFPEVQAGSPSIWQVVFHMDSGKKTMLVDKAHAVGYGINTTDTRIVLRSSYNTTEAQKLEVNGVPFSSVRSSTYYKQRWMLLMVDTAVACPLDGVIYTKETIIWTIPKDITPLLAGVGTIKELKVEMGINMNTISKQDRDRWGYSLESDKGAIVVKIPMGAPHGNYKSDVVAGKLMSSYKISPFVEYLWEDNKRGVTKHTILKEINTPLQLVPVTVTDYTNVSIQLFNVTIGTFLPDVELVSLTVDESGPLPLPEAEKKGYKIYEIKHPNGSKGYMLQVPFDTPGIQKEYVSDNIRNYSKTPILGFIVIPQGKPCDIPVPLVALVKDAVLPQAEGFCDDQALYLVMKRGNVDQDWLPYVKDTLLSQETAQSLGYRIHDNQTHLALRVPWHAAHVLYEEVGPLGIVATFQLLLKDRLAQTEMMDFAVSCIFSSKDLIDCRPNGTMLISAVKLVGIPDMDLSGLVLKDKRCRPASVTKEGATFIFDVSSCGTTRKFENATMTYENEVLYFLPGQATPVYQLKCACQYFIEDAVLLQYTPIEAPSPSILPGVGLLALALKLARDKSYVDFFQDSEYPVTRYLRDPLHFQVELLQSQDPQLELFLEDCWATAAADRNSYPQWNIVVDSCENSEDSHQTTFHGVPTGSVPFPTHLKRFEVKMFTFVVNSRALQGQVYFHCSVVICDSSYPSYDALCSRRCIPRRQRIGRSTDSTSDLHGYVSSGAIVIGRRNHT